MKIIGAIFIYGVVFHVCFYSPAPAYGYVPLDRNQFLKLEQLIHITLKARIVGFSDEELNNIVLKDNYNETKVLRIIDMINYIRDKYGFDDTQILRLLLSKNLDEIDLYEIANNYFQRSGTRESEKKNKIYTITDVFADLKTSERKEFLRLRNPKTLGVFVK